MVVLSGYKNIENKISTLVERTEHLPCVSYCNVRGNYCKWRLMWRSGFNLLFKLALLKQSLITLYRLLMLNYKCELQPENIQRSFFHLITQLMSWNIHKCIDCYVYIRKQKYIRQINRLNTACVVDSVVVSFSPYSQCKAKFIRETIITISYCT